MIAVKCTIPRCRTYVRMEEELRMHLKAHELSKDGGIPTARRSRPSRKRAGPSRTPLPTPQADERTFGCPVLRCDKEFANIWNRTRHIIRDHPDITTYECGDNLHGSRKKCAAMFLTQKEYRVHVIQDHGGEQ
ncbi:hypothetical protein PENSPDRAFT_412257 [Peniophora sp. CONT]|nr:hypothetical protein PENSPDRAFT_412257 [Peniophora sp. CONT]